MEDGTTVCGGILGRAFDPAALAREAAEQARKDELRQHDNVVLLEDWRRKPHFSCNTTA
jgi:hypothetical protein